MQIKKLANELGVQVTLVKTGIVDLVLELAHEGGTAVVWIEVKVHAAETGDQLARYRAYAAAHSELDVRLVTLARGVVSPTTQALTWRAVRAVARVSDSPYWRDLSTFLEEIAMADDHDLAVPAMYVCVRCGPRMLGFARRRWDIDRAMRRSALTELEVLAVALLVAEAWADEPSPMPALDGIDEGKPRSLLSLVGGDVAQARALLTA